MTVDSATRLYAWQASKEFQQAIIQRNGGKSDRNDAPAYLYSRIFIVQYTSVFTGFVQSQTAVDADAVFIVNFIIDRKLSLATSLWRKRYVSK